MGSRCWDSRQIIFLISMIWRISANRVAMYFPAITTTCRYVFCFVLSVCVVILVAVEEFCLCACLTRICDFTVDVLWIYGMFGWFCFNRSSLTICLYSGKDPLTAMCAHWQFHHFTSLVQMSKRSVIVFVAV